MLMPHRWILCISIGLSLILLGLHNIKESPKAMERIEKVASMTRQTSHAARDRVIHFIHSASARSSMDSNRQSMDH